MSNHEHTHNDESEETGTSSYKHPINLNLAIFGWTLKSFPFSIIECAARVAQGRTNYFDERLGEHLEFIKEFSCGVADLDGKIVWEYLKKILVAQTPSKGIDFLRDIGALKIILPELDNCYAVGQNPRYHKFTVYEHCLKTCDCCKTYDARLKLAALIHDVGKADTIGHNDKGTTFHKHEVSSTKKALRIVKYLGLDEEDANFVVSMVANHMYQYDRVWKDSTVLKFVRRVGLSKEYVGRLNEFPLFVLRQADRMGRELSPYTQKQLDFEARLEKVLLEA